MILSIFSNRVIDIKFKVQLNDSVKIR